MFRSNIIYVGYYFNYYLLVEIGDRWYGNNVGVEYVREEVIGKRVGVWVGFGLGEYVC